MEALAGKWLEKACASGQPFFAWVHFYDPHSPYAPPPPYATRYADHPYEGEIAYTDEVLGNLFARLQRLGVWDRTAIIVTADHGESLGEHGEEEHGFFIYDAVVHVPLIMRYPARIGRGVRVKTEARSVDLVPTVLDLAGLPPVASLPGRSLMPDIAGVRRAPVAGVLGEPLPAHPLRVERTALDPHGRLEVHPGAATRVVRPHARPGRAEQPVRRGRAAGGLSPVAPAGHDGGKRGTAIVADGTAKLDPATLQGWRASAT